MNAPTAITPSYRHTPLFPLGKDTTTYRKLTADGVRVEKIMGRDVIVVEREAMRGRLATRSRSARTRGTFLSKRFMRLGNA